MALLATDSKRSAAAAGAAAGAAPEPNRVLRFDMGVGATADAESGWPHRWFLPGLA